MNARKQSGNYPEISAETLGISHLDGNGESGWSGHRISKSVGINVVAEPSATGEVVGCAQQMVSEIIIRAKSGSTKDLAQLIKERTVDFPDHNGELVVYADVNDFRQIQELENRHPGTILDVIKKVKVMSNPRTGDKMLVIDTGDSDISRFNAYKNPVYAFGIVYYDTGFTTTTISIKHGDESFKNQFTFNIEITAGTEGKSSKIVNRISCTCNQNGETLNIYTNRQKGTNRNYSHYIDRLDNSLSKEETFNTFIEMLEYGFFNADFDKMFGI